MQERPILFSGPMVRAILDGAKTQTRRVMKRQPESTGTLLITPVGDLWYVWPHEQEPGVWVEHFCACPYGKPGDRLWVRETWVDHFGQRLYRADCHPDSFEYGATGWKPSIHMPRTYSRLVLEIVSIGVERVQSISDADIRAEGFPEDPPSWNEGFAAVWNKINVKRGYSWESNPWVWAIGFRQVTR